jgi:ubiquinone/menaquinone biosynthesis C-methylase UbiE
VTVKEGYDLWAGQYDDNDNLTRDLNMQRLRQADLPLSGARVFEAGCGTGLNTEFLAAHADQVIAMDFSEAMLDRARERTSDYPVRFEIGDVTRPWPATESSCDIVVITLVLEHVERLGPVFAQASRVLTDGGLLYIAELHPYRQFAGRQARFTPQGSDREVKVPAWTHTFSEYVSTALEAGFQLLRIEEIGDKPEQLPRLLQLWFQIRAGTSSRSA